MSNKHLHSTEDWNNIKSVFLELYLDENKTLKETRDELAKNYSFEASKEAFKFHIKRWKAFKNYSTAEKDNIAKHARLLQHRGGDATNLQVRGKPVKWHKIVRHVKGARDHNPALSQTTTRRISAKQPFASVRPALSDSYEQLFRASKNCFQWNTMCWISSKGIVESTPCTRPYRHFYRALGLLQSSSQSRRGWQALHEVCQNLADTAKNNTYTTLDMLMALGQGIGKIAEEQLRSHLFNYIRGLSLSVLPAGSPFKLMLQHLNTLEKAQSADSHIRWIINDMLFSQQHLYDQDIWCTLVVRNSYHLAIAGHLQTAEMYWSNLLQSSTLTISRQIQIYRVMARAYYQVGYLVQAMTTCQQALTFAQEVCETASHNITDLSFHLALTGFYHTLAFCHRARGEADECCAAFQRAANLCLKFGPTDTPLAAHTFSLWENALTFFERWDELRSLKADYPIMFSADSNAASNKIKQMSLGTFNEDKMASGVGYIS